MAQVATQPISKPEARPNVRLATVAWLLTAVYYFYQYAMRSAPAVMMPQLSEAFGVTTLAVASIVGLFYYGYSPFSLVAGAAMDRGAGGDEDVCADLRRLRGARRRRVHSLGGVQHPCNVQRYSGERAEAI